jgi:hypothetical protein
LYESPFPFVFKESIESHFVIVLCAISLAGAVLCLALITNHGTDHADGNEGSYFGKNPRYTSRKAFVTRDIFSDDLRDVISPNVALWSEQIGPDAGVAILFDEHKSQLRQLLNAWVATNNILLREWPPHSSHLLQPVEQGPFRASSLEDLSSSQTGTHRLRQESLPQSQMVRVLDVT